MSLEKLALFRKEKLLKYTTIKIGGEAKFFCLANNSQDLVRIIKELDSDFYVLGKGSNLLIKDGVLSKPVIKLGEGFSYIRLEKGLLEIGAATPLASIISYALQNSLGGIISLVGIPASLGGLLAMNASSFGASISSFVKEVEIINRKGEIILLNREDIGFGYRRSTLKGSIVLRAWLDLPAEVKGRRIICDLFKHKVDTQDLKHPSCGCVFKNPQDKAAGFLIEASGLKGLRHNDAQISLKHANFIINLGQASYKDVDYLIAKIKDKVYHKFNLELEEEIERWCL